MHLATIRTFAPGFAIHVDVRVSERRVKSIHCISFVLPLFHLFRRQFESSSRLRQHIDDVLGRFIRRIDNHVVDRALQLIRLLNFLVFQPTMHRAEIEKLDDTGGINSLIPAKARGDRMLRIAQIDQRD